MPILKEVLEVLKEIRKKKKVVGGEAYAKWPLLYSYGSLLKKIFTLLNLPFESPLDPPIRCLLSISKQLHDHFELPI